MPRHSLDDFDLHPLASSLGYGKNDKVTFTGNYIHHTSGRSPKLEFNSYWHAYNNYWFNNTGHAFDVGTGTKALIEGNVFYQVETPFLPDSSAGQTFAVSSKDNSTCDSKLGRTCAANALISSGNLSASDESVLSSWPSGEADAKVQQANQVKSSVLSNAGVGKLRTSFSKRQFEDAPYVPVFSSAGPGATPAGLPPKWTWRTVGVQPTPQPSGTPFPPNGRLPKDGSPFGWGF